MADDGHGVAGVRWPERSAGCDHHRVAARSCTAACATTFRYTRQSRGGPGLAPVPSGLPIEGEYGRERRTGTLARAQPEGVRRAGTVARKQEEGMKAVETPGAGDGTSKVTRLPRRPRRVAEEAGERLPKTRRSDRGSVYDPAPTKPVLRSELQRETGWWPVDPGAARHPAPKDDPGSAEPDASVIDLDALRRKRAGDDAPAAGIRRMVKPRRVGKSASERAGTEGQPDSGRNGDPDQVDGPAGPR